MCVREREGGERECVCVRVWTWNGKRGPGMLMRTSRFSEKHVPTVWELTPPYLPAPQRRVGVQRPAVEGEGEEEVVARAGRGGVAEDELGVVYLGVFRWWCVCVCVVSRWKERVEVVRVVGLLVCCFRLGWGCVCDLFACFMMECVEESAGLVCRSVSFCFVLGVHVCFG